MNANVAPPPGMSVSSEDEDTRTFVVQGQKYYAAAFGRIRRGTGMVWSFNSAAAQACPPIGSTWKHLRLEHCVNCQYGKIALIF